MDLRQLTYFARVAELGSFSRAALALEVAQPALSRHIRNLEVELRQVLLRRNGRGAVPTEAGLVLLAHARGILHQFERAREDLGQVGRSLAGRVSVGLPPSVARVLAVPLTKAFRLQMPDATLSIIENLSIAMVELLANGALDIAVLYNARPPIKGLEIVEIASEELMLVGPGRVRTAKPPPASVTLADVACLPLIIPSRPNAIRMYVESEMAQLRLRPTITMEIDGVSSILDLVEDGAGYAILSRNAVERSAASKAFGLRRIRAPRLRIPIHLAVSALRPSTFTQQATRKLIVDAASRLKAPSAQKR